MRKKNLQSGLSIMEVVLALAVLTGVVSAILVTTDNLLNAAVNARNRMRAFETARENMEMLLAQNSVKEMSEFGASEKYPEISWETIVEPFYEPITNRMWIQATCNATYLDSESEQQTIELTNWVTDLSKEDVQNILEQQKREEEYKEELENYPYGDSPEGLYQHASVLADTGDYYQAAQVVDELLERYPDSDPVEGIKNKIPEWAEKAADQGDYRTASDMSRSLFRYFPSSSAAERVADQTGDWNEKAKTQPPREDRRPEQTENSQQPNENTTPDNSNDRDSESDQADDPSDPQDSQDNNDQQNNTEKQPMDMNVEELMVEFNLDRQTATMFYNLFKSFR